MTLHHGGSWSVIGWRTIEVNGERKRVPSTYAVTVEDRPYSLAPGDHLIVTSAAGKKSEVRIQGYFDSYTYFGHGGLSFNVDRYTFESLSPEQRVWKRSSQPGDRIRKVEDL